MFTVFPLRLFFCIDKSNTYIYTYTVHKTRHKCTYNYLYSTFSEFKPLLPQQCTLFHGSTTQPSVPCTVAKIKNIHHLWMAMARRIYLLEGDSEGFCSMHTLTEPLVASFSRVFFYMVPFNLLSFLLVWLNHEKYPIPIRHLP